MNRHTLLIAVIITAILVTGTTLAGIYQKTKLRIELDRQVYITQKNIEILEEKIDWLRRTCIHE